MSWTLFWVCMAAIAVLTAIARILAERWHAVGTVWLCSMPFLALLAALWVTG